MDATEFQHARRTISEAGESLTDWLRVSHNRLIEWETGKRKIPRGRVRQIEWLLRLAENNKRLEASGLPECEWMRNVPAVIQNPWTADLANAKKELEEFDKRAEVHQQECPLCNARRAYAEKHLEPLPPFPDSNIVVRVSDRTPDWLLPVLIGAVGLGGIVLLRLLYLLTFLFIHWPGLVPALERFGMALLAVLAAAAAGAAGGLAVSLSRPLLKHLGALGDYMTGIVAAFAYLSALVVVSPLAFNEALAGEPTDWRVIAGLSALIGVAMTFGWRRDDRRERAGTA
jgi:hypothetical protein